METINVKINGVDYAVAKGSTVLEAARAAKVEIPTLCYLKDINEIGACRLCLVVNSLKCGVASSTTSYGSFESFLRIPTSDIYSLNAVSSA